MSFSKNRLDIETLFIDEFSRIRECVEIFAQNTVIDPPSTTWVRIVIQNATTDYTSVASKCARTTGIVAVQVHTPLEIGAGEADLVIDDVASVFRAANLDGIIFQPTNAVTIGQQDKFFRMDALTQFQADQKYQE